MTIMLPQVQNPSPNVPIFKKILFCYECPVPHHLQKTQQSKQAVPVACQFRMLTQASLPLVIKHITNSSKLF